MRFDLPRPCRQLLPCGDVDTDIDPVALNYYMTFHSVVPAPRTILSGVKKLPPASTLTIDARWTRCMSTPIGTLHFIS